MRQIEQRLGLGGLRDTRRTVEDEGRGDLGLFEQQLRLQQFQLETDGAKVFAQQEVHVLKGQRIGGAFGLRRRDDRLGALGVLAGIGEDAVRYLGFIGHFG